MTYQYLDDDDILIVNRSLARALGLNKSIVLRQVRYWISLNQKAKSERHFRDGCWWTFNTYEKWQEENFDFWAVDTVRRTFVDLEALGLLLSSSAYNQRSGDQTKWYTVNYGAYAAFIQLWHDHGNPRSGDSRMTIDYAAFIEDWNDQKTTYTNMASCVDQYGKLHRATVQVAKTITRDYPKITPESEEKAASVPLPRKHFAVKVYSGQDTYADGRYIDAMSQDFADSCNALFYAYLDALEAAGRKPDTSVDELWSQNYTATTALAKNRRLPEQITDYVTFVYSDKSDGFYKKLPAPIKLQAVANALPTWIQQKREVGTPQVTRPEHRVHTVAAVDPATVLTPEQRAAMMAEARAEYRKARTEVTAHV